ncbi:ABC transporter substrate-binding protein [Demequina salsinemoris]|uniref:ABC transporter substrate-binding protein n=1 Tax=Demequina salsinemoris TaxID=577470 RepID=UPI000785B225|nr:ABC transporter substrate-binding protein [Demequina salsinemoris]
MNIRHLRTAAMVAGIGIAIAGCSAADPSTDSSSSGDTGSGESLTLTLGSQVDVTTWSPADIGSGHYLQYLDPTYDGLLAMDAEGNIVANLATEWSWDDTNTVLTMSLRDDVTFTDGEPFDADAVVANIEADLAGTGTSASDLAKVESVTAIDSTTVEFTLSEVDPAFEYNLTLSGGKMASPASIEAGTLDTDPVGSGPYVYDAASSTVGSEYHFTRNEDYWNSDAYPYDELVIMPLTDDTARETAVLAGTVDAVVGSSSWVEKTEAAGLETLTYPLDWMGLFLDDRAGDIVPALGDVRVRQAINYAFDKEAILESLNLGYGTVTSQIFSPDSAAYDESLDDYYTYDPEKAKELLAEAGYADGFTLPMPSSDWSATYDAVVQQQLAAVGITVEYESIPTTNVLSRLPDFAAHWFTWSEPANAWGSVSNLISSTGVGNYQAYEDDDVTATLETILATTGDEQDAAYQELNNEIVEQAWFAPWFRVDTVLIHSADVDVEPLAGNIVPSLAFYTPAS